MSQGNSTTNFMISRLVVGVGDMAVSNSSTAIISTFALGSCIGVVVYDSNRRAGGILHYMLPDSNLSPDKAKLHPYMFADTGLNGFFKALQGVGVTRKNAVILIVGGASVISQNDLFRIGERNIVAVKRWFKDLNLNYRHELVGGINNRTVHLTNKDGSVQIKEPNGVKTFSLL